VAIDWNAGTFLFNVRWPSCDLFINVIFYLISICFSYDLKII